MLRCRDPGGDPIGGEPEIVHILGNVEVEQLERSIGVFSTAGAEARGRHGNRGAQLCRGLIVARDGQGLSANRFWGFGVRKR